MPIEGTVQENSQGTYDAYEGAFTLLESADVTMAQEGAKAVDEATTTSLAEFPGQPRIEIVCSSPIGRSLRGSGFRGSELVPPAPDARPHRGLPQRGVERAGVRGRLSPWTSPPA